MVIASWNVNSIRARLEHVRGWLTQRNPDVLLLQELKAVEFPAELFQELGYTSAAVTQKTYNGLRSYRTRRSRWFRPRLWAMKRTAMRDFRKS
jgi:exonuclease III